MQLQCDDQESVRRIEGAVVKVTESDDGWIIVQFETFFQEFRMLFREDDADDEESQWAHYIYTLKETTRDLSGQEVLRWQPAYGYEQIDKMYPKLANIMTSADLTDYRRNAYLANGWNQIDCFVVLVSVVGLAFPNVRFLRALRAIRPLRLAVRVDEIRVVLSAVVGAFPGVVSTFFFCILFWAVLSILGCLLFPGMYGACPFDDPTYINEKDDCTIETACRAYWDYVLEPENGCTAFDPCNDLICRGCTGTADSLDMTDSAECNIYDGDDEVYVPVEWGNPDFNFDTVPLSLRTIYVLATLDEWTGMMFAGMDTRGTEYLQPRENASNHLAIYFLAAVVITAFVSFNLIISVVVDNFNRIKSEKDGSAFLLPEQKRWRDSKLLIDRIALSKRFPQPQNRIRQYAFRIFLNPYFEPLIIACICINAMTMAMEHDQMSQTFEDTLNYLDLSFVIIFFIEMCIKLLAINFRNYFDDGWNVFDFAIVVLSLIGLVYTEGPGISVARVFRIGRVLRLLQKAETLRTLFTTVLYSIPSLWNIGLLLFVVFFIYSVIGMNLFGAIQPDVEDNGINSDGNFQTFPNAMMMLYRLATYDAWGPVYKNCMVSAPDECVEVGTPTASGEDCNCIPGETCGSELAATVYFVTFGLFGALVMINLFIAVILDTFEDSLKLQIKEKFLSPVFVWSQIWSRVDTEAYGQLEVMDFIHTIVRSPDPVGLGSYLQCAVLLGEHDLLSCVKDERLNQKLTKKLASMSRYEKVLDPYPHQDQVLRILSKLQLLCRRKVDSHGVEKWIVTYEDAVVAVGTGVVGPTIYVDETEINDDCQKVSDWFINYFSVAGGPSADTHNENAI